MKVCFVGVGSIARLHIRNLVILCKKLGIDLCVDVLRRKTSDSTDLPEVICNVYTSVEGMPADYDVVFLTNPTEYHADMLIALHDYARHFFIEKPITSFKTIDKLNDFSFRDDSVYYVACPLRYTRVIQYLKEHIDIKTVNAIRSISSSYLPDWRPGTDYRESYSARKDLGGGVDTDLIHEWDYITYLFGIPSLVKYFSGKVSKLDIDSSDYAIYIAQFGEDMICELHLDYFGRKRIRTVEIYMDEDTVVGNLIEGTVKYLKSGKTVDLHEERTGYQMRELSHFLSLIKDEGRAHNNVFSAMKVLRLTQGII